MDNTKDQKTLAVESALTAELTKLAKQESEKPSVSHESGAERIKSSVARLTSNSIEELQGLVSELQKLQEFLKTEVDSVQLQIDSALAGISIIIDTIGPWKTFTTSPTVGAGDIRRGPPISIETVRRLSGVG